MQILNGTSAGVNALAFLYSLDLAYLQEQSADFWAPWIPSLIGDSRVGHENNDAISSVLQMAAVAEWGGIEPMGKIFLLTFPFNVPSTCALSNFRPVLVPVCESDATGHHVFSSSRRSPPLACGTNTISNPAWTATYATSFPYGSANVVGNFLLVQFNYALTQFAPTTTAVPTSCTFGNGNITLSATNGAPIKIVLPTK
jgi:hypothetical protein